MAAAAIRYGRHGWAVVPLQGKRPRIKDWPNHATTDERQILAWMHQFGETNIGIATGERSGFFVLDVDGPEGEQSLSKLIAEHGALPATLEGRTGGGGRHILFQFPEGTDLGNSAKNLGAKLDIRGNGGQIVAPPSIHPDTGCAYEWASDPEWTEIAPAPAWLLELLTKREEYKPAKPAATVTDIGDQRARKYGLGVLESQAKELAETTSGGRNGKLNWAAYRTARFAASCGISESEAYDALMAAADRCGLIDDDGLRSAAATFNSGWRKGVNEPLDPPPPPDREVPAPPKQRKPAPPAEDFNEDLLADYEARAEELADEEDDQGGDGDGYDSDGTGTSGEGPRPIIEVQAGELDRIVTEAEVALMHSGIQVYQRGGRLVRPIRQAQMTLRGIKRGDGTMLVREVEEPWLVEAFTKAAIFKRYDGRMDRLKVIDCPVVVARTYMARDGQWNVPPLLGIIEAPTLRPDGTVLEDPGYDPETGLLFNPGRTQFVPVPENPTREDAVKALERITSLLKGFPFEERHDEAIAVAAILTGLVRRSIPTSPLFAFNAPKMGSGKSLLADVVSLFATGRRASVMTPAANPEEEGKRLLAVLMEGDPVVCVDNISAAWASDAMCTVLTQETWTARVLGATKTASAPTSVTWLATGNNLTFIGDLTTRVMRCDLDPQIERPEERDFDVNLHSLIPEQRGELVPAALTILRAYEVAGRPKQDIAPYGRFEAWSALVRSALVWVGMADPCLCRADLEASDTVRSGLVAVLAGWHAAVGSGRCTAQEIIGLSRLSENAELQAALMEVAGAGSEISPKRLGRWLAKYEKRIEGGFRLVKEGVLHKSVYWKVVKVDGGFGGYGGSSSSTQEKSQKENAKLHEQGETNPQNTPNPHFLKLFEEGDA
jgi:hypothetical protein